MSRHSGTFLSIKPQNNRPRLEWTPARSEQVDFDDIDEIEFTLAKADGSGVAAYGEADYSATDNQLLYTFENSDLPEAGIYEADFEITYEDGDTQRSPNDGNLVIEVISPPTDTEWGTYETRLDINARDLTAQTATVYDEPSGSTDVARLEEIDDLWGEIDQIDGIEEGRSYIGTYLYDDFGDSDIDDRSQSFTGYYLPDEGGSSIQGQYRPEWDVDSGVSNSDDSNALEFDAQSAIRIETDLEAGYWEFELEHDGDAFDTGVVLYPFTDDDVDNYWRIQTRESGRVLLEKSDDGNSKILASSQTTAIRADERQTVGVLRTPGGSWHVFVDDDEVARYEDDWMPSGDLYFRIRTQPGTEATLHQVTSRPGSFRNRERFGSEDTTPHRSIGLETLTGDYHAGTHGMLIKPKERIHLGTCIVDAEESGTTTLYLRDDFDDGEGTTGGFDGETVIFQREIEVDEGENKINLDVYLDPLEDHDWYFLSFDSDGIAFRRSAPVPTDRLENNSVELSAGTRISGSLTDRIYYFFDLRVAGINSQSGGLSESNMSYYRYDDFEDGKSEDRRGHFAGHYFPDIGEQSIPGIYRPEWESASGSGDYFGEPGYIEFDAPQGIATQCDITTARWNWGVEFLAEENDVMLLPATEHSDEHGGWGSAENFWRVRIEPDEDQIGLEKREDGSDSVVDTADIDGDYDGIIDVELTRTRNGVLSVSYDGEQKITTTDSWVPDADDTDEGLHSRVYVNPDQDIRLHYFSVRPVGGGAIESTGNGEGAPSSELGAPIIEDNRYGIEMFAGGRWVTGGVDPANHYEDEVLDGHVWDDLSKK